MRTCGECCKHYILTFGFIGFFAFLVCYLWRYALTGADVQAAHEMMLRVAVIGYTGHNGMSLFLGLLQFTLWGMMFGGIYSMFEQSRKCEDCEINVIVE